MMVFILTMIAAAFAAWLGSIAFGDRPKLPKKYVPPPVPPMKMERKPSRTERIQDMRFRFDDDWDTIAGLPISDEQKKSLGRKRKWRLAGDLERLMKQ